MLNNVNQDDCKPAVPCLFHAAPPTQRTELKVAADGSATCMLGTSMPSFLQYAGQGPLEAPKINSAAQSSSPPSGVFAVPSPLNPLILSGTGGAGGVLAPHLTPLPLGREMSGLSPLPMTNTLVMRVAKVWPTASFTCTMSKLPCTRRACRPRNC